MTSEEESSNRTYLDHAATGWPKPPGVLQAAIQYQTHCGASVGRGAYRSSIQASKLLQSARQQVVRLIGANSAEEIAFTANGTQALVAGLFGILKSGDHVVTSRAEHNSVLRPLAQLAKSRGIEWIAAKCGNDGLIDVDDLKRACNAKTRLIIMTHASNVTGVIQPIEEVAAVAKERGILFFVDAAQTVGYCPIDVKELGIDVLAFPGHKGACGLLGTGVLYLRRELVSDFENAWCGGTGTESSRIEGPFGWQESVESGNLNMPAIASLECGMGWVRTEFQRQRVHLESLQSRVQSILQDSPLFRVIDPARSEHRVPVFSVVPNSVSPQELAALFDSSFGIEVRAGLHCAGLIHDNLGTNDSGGTVRISLGHTSTSADVDALESAVKSMEQYF